MIEEGHTGSSIQVTPTGRPDRPLLSRAKPPFVDPSVIVMLQKQQVLLQQVISTQKTMTERQQKMEEELLVLQGEVDKEESAISTSSGCSSSGTSVKRKRTVSRTLSVS